MALFTCHWRSCNVRGEITGDGSTLFGHDIDDRKVFFCSQEHLDLSEVDVATTKRVRAEAAKLAAQQASAPEAVE